MKILHINKFYYLKGGSERYMFELAERLEKAGHQVVSFSMKDENNFETPYSSYFADSVNVSEFSLKNIIKIFYNRDAAKKLQKLIDKEKPDVAHLHNFAHQLSPSIIRVLKRNKIPIVQTLHDYKLICPNYRLFSQNEVCFKCQRQKYYNCAARKCIQDSYARSLIGTLEAYLNNKILKLYDKIDLYIAPSRFMKNISVKFGIHENRIAVLNNPVDLPQIVQPVEAENYLLYFGRISKEKGTAVLIKAMAGVKDNLKLVIVGDGPDKKRYKEMAGKLNLNDRIEFKGPLYGQELTDIILKAKAVVLPSIWPENMPYVLLESMALGKVVIASNIGGLGELIKNNKSGFLFPAGDHVELGRIINILDDFDLDALGKAAAEKARQINWATHIKNLTEIYESLAGKKKKS